MSTSPSSNDGEMWQHRDEILALRELIRKEGGCRKDSDHDNEKDGNENGDGATLVVTTAILESTVVPAMRQFLKEREDSKRKNSNTVEEKKEAGETRSSSPDETDHKKIRADYTVAILECLINFIAATCGPPKRKESSAEQTSYNSLSFRRSTTPKKEKLVPSKPKYSSNPKEDKDVFVKCGAFEMSVSVLREILEEHTVKSSSSSWSRNKGVDLDTIDSIGVADSSADVKIESMQPENEIPALVMHLIACLTHNASDEIKSRRVLPHLTAIVHKSMMVFLPSPEVQAYGCWTLYSLSNPLLQELIAAGSVSVLVRAMKCHTTDVRVQEHGNKSLYNLLPLLVFCTNQNDNNENQSNNVTNPNPLIQKPDGVQVQASYRIEIDGEQLEDYSSLVPGLPAIILRGMEFHPENLAIQQYGLLALMRLCKFDPETYEVIISEGGLMAILQVVTMATKAKSNLNSPDQNPSGYDDLQSNNNRQSMSERYDCLVQMSCQFLRDLSRPTNSSMDILRIIAVKGGMKTVLKLLDYYNQESMRCGGGNSGLTDYYGNSQKFSIINVIDPALACLRNLMTNEDNRSEVMTFVSMAKTLEQEHQPLNPYGDDDDDSIFVCANLMPIVLKTMDSYPLDAPIQAYGCDLLGRLAQGELSARIELIKTTIDPDSFGAGVRASRNVSRLWKDADSPKNAAGSGSEGNEDVDIVDLSDQMRSSVISSSPKYMKNVDAFMTAIRAMRDHLTHQGVQERAVTLIISMIIDWDVDSSVNSGNNASQLPSSDSLIQRLQEAYDLQKEKDNPATFLAFLKSTVIAPKGVERLKTLTKMVDDFDRKKNRNSDSSDFSNSRQQIGNFFRGWKMRG